MSHQPFYDTSRCQTGGGCCPKGINSGNHDADEVEPIARDPDKFAAAMTQAKSRASEAWEKIKAQRAAIETWHAQAADFMAAPPPVAVTIRVRSGESAEVELFPDNKDSSRQCATVRVIGELDTFPGTEHLHRLRSAKDRACGFMVFLDRPSVTIVEGMAKGATRLSIDKLAIRIVSLAPNGKSGRGAIVTFKA